MPLDGITISAIAHELREKLLSGRIDKIYQPEGDEIILQIRAKGSNHKLLMSAGNAQPRIHLTKIGKENPLKPPQFCMVLRKHLTGSKILNIVQPAFERIIEMHLESMNEMGDLSPKRLSIEIMGKHSNIILIDENNMVLDSAKHISYDKSSVRRIIPGVEFTPPPGGKQNPLETDKEGFNMALSASPNEKIQTSLFRAYNGLSPVMSRELCERADLSPDSIVSQLNNEQIESLFQAFSHCMEAVQSCEYENAIYSDSGIPIDFSSIAITQYKGFSTASFDSPSEMTEVFCLERDTAYRIKQKTADLRKLIKQNIERCTKKSDKYKHTLDEIKDREDDRIKGELLTAYIHTAKKGMTTLSVSNYYEVEAPEITISMDPNLSPSENAQVYFKRYNKAKRSFIALQDQIKQNDEDLEYLSSVQNSIDSVSNESDIADIRDELAETGFIKKRSSNSKKRAKKSKPIKYISSDGYDMYVGKNNKQNDELTLRFAASNDIWFHTKNIPGSHVIVKSKEATVSDIAIKEAALIAAYYSKARQSSQVPVDYTSRKNVKKPSGAKPGMVIYDNYNTVYVTPQDDLIQQIRLSENFEL